MTTCSRRLRWPRPGGAGSKTSTMRARWRISCPAILIADSTTAVEIDVRRVSPSAREKLRSPRTMVETRSAPARLLEHRHEPVQLAGSSAIGRSLRAIHSRLSITYARGLLISWATPAARVPSAARRSACTSCASSARARHVAANRQDARCPRYSKETLPISSRSTSRQRRARGTCGGRPDSPSTMSGSRPRLNFAASCASTSSTSGTGRARSRAYPRASRGSAVDGDEKSACDMPMARGASDELAEPSLASQPAASAGAARSVHEEGETAGPSSSEVPARRDLDAGPVARPCAAVSSSTPARLAMRSGARSARLRRLHVLGRDVREGSSPDQALDRPAQDGRRPHRSRSCCAACRPRARSTVPRCAPARAARERLAEHAEIDARRKLVVRFDHRDRLAVLRIARQPENRGFPR